MLWLILAGVGIYILAVGSSSSVAEGGKDRSSDSTSSRPDDSTPGTVEVAPEGEYSTDEPTYSVAPEGEYSTDEPTYSIAPEPEYSTVETAPEPEYSTTEPPKVELSSGYSSPLPAPGPTPVSTGYSTPYVPVTGGPAIVQSGYSAPLSSGVTTPKLVMPSGIVLGTARVRRRC